MKRFLLPLPILLCLGGCASMVPDAPQTILVQSLPSGAQVRVNSGEKGWTPFRFTVGGENGERSATLVISQPGHRPLVVEVKADPAAGDGRWRPNPVVVELAPFSERRPSVLLSEATVLEKTGAELAPIPAAKPASKPEGPRRPAGVKVDANGTEYL